jgi:hypothetical protein
MLNFKEKPQVIPDKEKQLDTSEQILNHEQSGKSVARKWLTETTIDEQIQKHNTDIASAPKQKIDGSDWSYEHTESNAIRSIDTPDIHTIEKNGIIQQLTGRPMMPENGTDAYIYGHYIKNRPTIAFVNGMGEPTGFANIIDKEQANDNNTIVIAIDYSKSLHDNVAKIIETLHKMKEQDIEINELVAHSAGNRFTLELLHELGIRDDNLLSGTEIIGLNPKLADDNAEGHSTGIAGTFTKLAGDITGGGYDHITEMMDAKNSTNKYLKGNLSNIKKALGDGSISFIVAQNDPHNPDPTTSAGRIFSNVLSHANQTKYIRPKQNPHEYLLYN